MLPFIRTIPAIKALNTFALALLQKQLQLSGVINGNILISPLSIYITLSMVYNGAANATKNAMAETLQLYDIDTRQLNEICKQLIEQLPTEDAQVSITIANAIWHNKNLHPLATFLTVKTEYYHAVVQHISTAEAVNTWVADKTRGKIRSIINDIKEDTLMLLVNTVYFNAKWQQPFPAYGTYTNNFYPGNGDVVETEFMNQDIIINNCIDTDYRIVELPYGNGSSYSIYIMDGNSKTNIKDFIAGLNTGILKAMMLHMQRTKVELNLPKWESSYNIEDMRPLLTALGVGIVFTEAAEFTNMYKEPAFISGAVHKTYIKVAEKGTTAAAVTAMAVACAAAPVPPPPVITFNRPFLYVIVAKQTGAMLFTGVVNNPLLKG